MDYREIEERDYLVCGDIDICEFLAEGKLCRAGVDCETNGGQDYV